MVLPRAEGRREADQGSRRILEGRGGESVATLGAIDRVYLRRACELGARGRGGTAPNPAVGAVIARGTTTLGEGFHRKRGEPHAEVEALRDAARAGHDVRGATLYVTLEPCNHAGSTPPCAQAVLDAGLARVVVGLRDPNPVAAGGSLRLRAAGVAVDVADDPWARALVDDFVSVVTRGRPLVTVKLAASLDGYVAPAPGPFWLTGERAREAVRDVRAAHDAVLVGAGTVLADDPQLTLRPPRSRRRPYLRAVAAGRRELPAASRVFAPRDGYAPTAVFVPAGSARRFAGLGAGAAVREIAADGGELDLRALLEALRADGVSSVLCEGGPTLAGRLLTGGLVDRLIWLVAPMLLGNAAAVPALAGGPFAGVRLAVESVERLGDDVLISARVGEGSECSAD